MGDLFLITKLIMFVIFYILEILTTCNMKCDQCSKELDKFYFLSMGKFNKQNILKTPDKTDDFEIFEKVCNFCSYDCANIFRKENDFSSDIPIYKISRCVGYYDCEKLDNIRHMCEDVIEVDEEEIKKEERRKQREERKQRAEELRKLNVQKGGGLFPSFSNSVFPPTFYDDILDGLDTINDTSFLKFAKPRPPRCQPSEVAIIKANLRFIDIFEKYDKESTRISNKLLNNIEKSIELNDDMLGYTTEASSLNKEILYNSKKSSEINDKMFKNLKQSSKINDNMVKYTIRMRFWAIIAVILSGINIILLIYQIFFK